MINDKSRHWQKSSFDGSTELTEVEPVEALLFV